MRLKAFLFYFAVISTLFLSCDKDTPGDISKEEPDNDVIWDFVNYSVKFSVTDTQGNDLLDSTNVNNILTDSSKWHVTYNNKNYQLLPQHRIETKCNMPIPLGLRFQQLGSYEEEGKFQLWRYGLTFGEFSPTENFKSESFIIHWDESRQTEITFDLYITWDKGDPTVHKSLSIDSVLQPEDWPVVKIVIPS